MFANAGLSPFVAIWTARAASLYTSHNFWCAAAVSAAVYVGSAVVPAAVAGPLFVGRVSATIKAAAPSTTAAIATLATAANGQLRERGGAGGWVGVHCPVVGGGGGGVLVTRVRLLQLPCLCTPPACQQRLVATLAWATAVGRFRCRGRRSCGWRPLLRLGRCGAVRRGGVPFRPGWVRVPRYLVRCGLAGRRSPRATRVGDH